MKDSTQFEVDSFSGAGRRGFVGPWRHSNDTSPRRGRPAADMDKPEIPNEQPENQVFQSQIFSEIRLHETKLQFVVNQSHTG